MLYPEKVLTALHARQTDLHAHESLFAQELGAYRAAWRNLAVQYQNAADLNGWLDTQQGQTGARATRLYTTWQTQRMAHQTDPVLPFMQPFAHHEGARAWAEQVIRGITTVAVDGSQIMPWGDASLPIGLVQAGIFANPHLPGNPYLKDVRVSVLGPNDLQPDEAYDDDEEILQLAAEDIVSLRRFELEAQTIGEWMEQWQGDPQQPPVAFFDGSLIVSFAISLPAAPRQAYLMAVIKLIKISERTRIPLVAYIDHSRARDLVQMLAAALPDLELSPNRRITDALVLDEPTLGWGDATVPLIAARGDMLAEYGMPRGAVVFAYIRTAQDQPPARIEVPRWVIEQDRLEYVLNVLRAELVAGNGYPYAIETADAVAVISVPERMQFFGIMQRFSEAEGIPLRFSHKALSKQRRR